MEVFNFDLVEVLMWFEKEKVPSTSDVEAETESKGRIMARRFGKIVFAKSEFQKLRFASNLFSRSDLNCVIGGGTLPFAA